MSGLRELWTGLPSTFWYLWTGTVVNRVGGFIVPFLALYLTSRRDLGVAQAGQVVALYGLGSLAAGPVGGYCADRIGRRPTLIVALFAAGAAMLLLGFAQPIWLIGAATLLVGFFSDLARAPVAATVADVVPANRRAHAYSLLYWASNLGFSIAPVIAGAVASRSYLALFIADAVTTIAYGVLVAVKVPETRPAEAKAQRHRGLHGLKEPLTDPTFLAFGALVFLLAMVFFQFQVALPVDMRAHGVTEAQYGALIAINGVLIVLFQPFAGRWLIRYRRSSVLAAACVLTGVGFALPALSPVPAVYALGIAIWTAGEILHSPMPPAIVADLAPPSLRGSYQGALHVAWGASFFLAPAVGSFVFDRFGPRALWLGCLGVALFIAAAHGAIAPARRRRMAALRAERPVGQVSFAED